MTESRLNPANWLEPRTAVASIRQLVQYQCALTEGYVHWSVAQTALALTATSPVEYLSRQAKLGADMRKQWADKFAALINPRTEPKAAAIQSEVSASPALTAPPAVAPSPAWTASTDTPTPSPAAVTRSLAPVIPAPTSAAPVPVVAVSDAASALSPGLAAVLPKLRKANTKGAKSGVLPEIEPPPANGSLRALSVTPSPAAADRSHTSNGATAARSALTAQENLRQKQLQRARKATPSKTHGKRPD